MYIDETAVGADKNDKVKMTTSLKKVKFGFDSDSDNSDWDFIALNSANQTKQLIIQ